MTKNLTKKFQLTFYLIIVAFLFNKHQVRAQTTSIPDPYFENKLIQLGVDSDGLINGQILNSDAAATTVLTLDQDTIHSLEGIHAFVNLDTLRCLGIKELLDDSLVFSGHSSLRYIQFTNTNNIRYLDFSNNPALTIIYCAFNNALQYADFSNNAVLADLNCQNNLLTEVDVSNNIALGFFRCNRNQLSDLDLSNTTNLTYLDCSNNELSRLALPDTTLGAMNSIGNKEFLQICVPNLTLHWSKTNWIKDFWAVYISGCFAQAVNGRVAIDLNSNCLVDSFERGISTQIIKFERDSTAVYCNTLDSFGNYRAYLDTGLYTVSVIPSNSYWQACPSNQQVYVDTNYAIQTINWSLETAAACPLLMVDIVAPFLRRAGGGSRYTVSYCNEGTAAATNAFVKVNLDPSLNFVSSTMLASQNGNVYTFSLGQVGVAECNSFGIQVTVDSSAAIGQAHCTEAQIFPDSICIPDLWAGAKMNVSGVCQNNNVVFTIENVGSDMAQTLSYYIVEDNIMMKQGNFNLNSAVSVQVVEQAKPGRTYRIWVEQENGYPSLLGNRFATTVLEGCVLDSVGGFNTGFVTQYDNDNSSPFIAVDCQENIASYDPNDKTAQPRGEGAEHYIYDYTDLDYKVRFQNTGSDTAFLVVIRDTISPYLDPSTLIMGASSHAYTWTLSGEGVLEVRFADIMLVDSTTNALASNGFFQYKIQQKVGNPIGTIINNTAAIYFDYNPPIFTNTTFHEIGEHFIPIVLAVGKVFEEEVTVNVYPNPFTDWATIEVMGIQYEALNLKVFDLRGRLVAEKSVENSNRIELSNNNLPTGIYIYQLKGDEKLINTGKIIAQ